MILLPAARQVKSRSQWWVKYTSLKYNSFLYCSASFIYFLWESWADTECDYLEPVIRRWAVSALALDCITHTTLPLELCVFHLARLFLKKATNGIVCLEMGWAYFFDSGLERSAFHNTVLKIFVSFSRRTAENLLSNRDKHATFSHDGYLHFLTNAANVTHCYRFGSSK